MTISAGKHTLKIWADYDNQIDESDESDNIWEMEFEWQDAGAKKALELINVERLAHALDPLEWRQDWADACLEHAQQLELAGNDEYMPDSYGADNKQLLDYDATPATGYRLAPIVATGAWGRLAEDAQEFFNLSMVNSTVKQAILKREAEQFGCGLDDNTWIAIVSQ